MKKQKRNKKFFAALLMGVLALSGLAINVSAIDDSTNPRNSFNGNSYGVFKDIKNNPFDFIKTEKLSVPSNFDYIEQMNNEFAGDFYLDKESSHVRNVSDTTISDHPKIPNNNEEFFDFAGDSLKTLKEKLGK